MKRVQVLLDEWQHTWLQAEAERTATSVSALLRVLLTESIERRQMGGLTADPIWGIVGLGEGPADGVNSENLDQFLYRADWERRPLAMVAEGTGVADDRAGEP